ncbi:MAG: T9SS C-terminal target domain-containing protein, partial [Bacteroidetes bacterium]|nr:T9SS C-terminal target domain-containing protein [Bacteroidota bacterium]
ELETYDRRGEGGLVKLDASLNLEWAHSVYPAVTNGTAYQDAMEVEPGAYMLIGTTAAPIGRLASVDFNSAYAVRIQSTGENAIMRSEITSSFVWQSSCEIPEGAYRTRSWHQGVYWFKWWSNSVHVLTQQFNDCADRNPHVANATLSGISAFPTTRVAGWLQAAVASTRPYEYLYLSQTTTATENGNIDYMHYGKSLSVPNAGTSLTVNSPNLCVGCRYMDPVDIAQTDFGAVVAFNTNIDGRSIVGVLLDVDSSLASTGIEDEGFASRLRLEQNYPNPFNPSTLIRFRLDQPSEVQVDVFSMTGQHVARLAEGMRDIGEHRLEFDGGGLASGVYLLRLTTPSYVETRKMTLVK